MTGILTALDHKKLKNPQLFEDHFKGSRSKSSGRTLIRRRIKNSIIELTEILNYEGLTEDDVNLIFTPEILNPFFRAIFRFKKEKINEKTRKRLVRLSQALIRHLGYHGFAQKLCPNLYKLLASTTHETGSLLGIRTLDLAREWQIVQKRKARKQQ